MFVDASAICAIILQERDAVEYSRSLETDAPKSTSEIYKFGGTKLAFHYFGA